MASLDDFFNAAVDFGGSLLPYGAQYWDYNRAKTDTANVAAQMQAAASRGMVDVKGYLDPYQAGGLYGLQQYQQLLQDPSSVAQDPGYQFQLGQGLQALERSAAAKGQLMSGQTLADITKYGQDYASTSYDQALSRRFGLIQPGLTAATTAAPTLADLHGMYGEAGATEHLVNMMNRSNAINGALQYGAPPQSGLASIVDTVKAGKNLWDIGKSFFSGGSSIAGGVGSMFPGAAAGVAGSAAPIGIGAMFPGASAGVAGGMAAPIGANALGIGAAADAAGFASGIGAQGLASVPTSTAATSAGATLGMNAATAGLVGGALMVPFFKALSNTGTGGWDVKYSKLFDGINKPEKDIDDLLSGRVWGWGGRTNGIFKNPENDNYRVIGQLIKDKVISPHDPRLKKHLQMYWDARHGISQRDRDNGVQRLSYGENLLGEIIKTTYPSSDASKYIQAKEIVNKGERPTSYDTDDYGYERKLWTKKREQALAEMEKYRSAYEDVEKWWRN